MLWHHKRERFLIIHVLLLYVFNLKYWILHKERFASSLTINLYLRGELTGISGWRWMEVNREQAVTWPGGHTKISTSVPDHTRKKGKDNLCIRERRGGGLWLCYSAHLIFVSRMYSSVVYVPSDLSRFWHIWFALDQQYKFIQVRLCWAQLECTVWPLGSNGSRSIKQMTWWRLLLLCATEPHSSNTHCCTSLYLFITMKTLAWSWNQEVLIQHKVMWCFFKLYNMIMSLILY